MNTAIQPQELDQFTRDVCETMLGLNISPSDQTPDGSINRVATVSIRGEWNAILEVATTEASARTLGKAMFDLPEPSEEEITDAIAEIANMIGGNIKGSVGGECQLSLPCVGHDIMDADDVTGLSFELQGDVFHVILQQTNAATALEGLAQ